MLFFCAGDFILLLEGQFCNRFRYAGLPGATGDGAAEQTGHSRKFDARKINHLSNICCYKILEGFPHCTVSLPSTK